MVCHLPCHFGWLSLNFRAQPGFRTPSVSEKRVAVSQLWFWTIRTSIKSFDLRQQKIQELLQLRLIFEKFITFFHEFVVSIAPKLNTEPALISDETVHIFDMQKVSPRRLSVLFFDGEAKKICPSIAKCREINRPNCRCYLFSGIRCRRIANKNSSPSDSLHCDFQCALFT